MRSDWSKGYRLGDVTRADFQRNIVALSNGNRTEWSPIRSVIMIRVITKSDDRVAGVRFVYHESDYRLNSTTRSLIPN